MKKKVFVATHNQSILDMFLGRGWGEAGGVDDAKLVVFPGGADVDPSLYGQEVHPKTWSDPSEDRYWMEVFEDAVDKGVPISGICKGSQFVVVANGGSLFQDIDNHAIYGTHPIKDLVTGEEVDVTSTHHQQFNDIGLHGELVASVPVTLTTRKEWMFNGNEVDSHHKEEVDKEVVWYNKTRCLATQFHPEYVDKKHECQEYYFSLLERYLSI